MNKERKTEITIEPFLWTAYSNNEGRHSVKLKVTVMRRSKFYLLKFNNKNLWLNLEEFTGMMSLKPKGELKAFRESIDASRTKALDAVNYITRENRPFSHERFEKEYFAETRTSGFLDLFDRYLADLLSQGRIGTHRSYKNAYDVLVLFLDKKKIHRKNFSAYEITFEFLKELEQFLLADRGKTTLGIYARTIRTIYNYCASQDYRLKELYPFGKGPGKYKIQNSIKGNKRGDAFTSTELKRFIDTDPDYDSPEYEAKMIWLFSFYCQGMNFKDICLLKYQNIKGQTIQYVREKTKRSEEEVIEIAMSEHIRQIIVKLGNPDKSPQAYLFDFLPAYEADPFVLEPIILQKIKITNKWLKRLCLANGLPAITTYWSRHTYASLLKFSGVPVEMIRELLGHSDLRTTEHYLKRFDLMVKRDINNRLFDQIMAIAS